MKSAQVFLAGMYLHLVLSIAVPVTNVVFFDSWDSGATGLMYFYLLMIGVVQIAGWVCVVFAAAAYLRGRPEPLRRGWKLLKLWSIPFYLLNFVYSVFAWFILLAASRGMIFFLLPIPVIVTCLMIFQSGCVGIFGLMDLRKRTENGGKPSRIHYLLQLIPVADVVSTVLLLRRYTADPDRESHSTV